MRQSKFHRDIDPLYDLWKTHKKSIEQDKIKMKSELYERFRSIYTYEDLVGIIQLFCSSCSERCADAEWACELADEYDPEFNYEEQDDNEES